jgi:hypothetical protein
MLKLLGEETAVFCFVAYVVNILYIVNICLKYYIHGINNRRQQFPRPIILILDDDQHLSKHIVVNF